MSMIGARAAALGRDEAAALVRAREHLSAEGVIPKRSAAVRRDAPEGKRVRTLLTRTGVDAEHVAWLADRLEMIARQTLKRENVGVRRQGPDFVVDDAGVIAFCKGVGRFVRSHPPRRVEIDSTMVRPTQISATVQRRPRAMTVSPARAHTERTAPRAIPETVRAAAPKRQTVAPPPPKAIAIDAALRAEVDRAEELRRTMDVEPGYQYGLF